MIRSATSADVPALLALVQELATYERAADAVAMEEADLQAALFGTYPAAFCEVAEVAAQVVGMALWFPTFSTWTGQVGIHLEDLFVRPEARGAGHGRALLARLARICHDRGYPRLEWNVLDWNAPAIGFYTALGAVAMTDWTTFRLAGAPLAALADTAPDARQTDR